MTFFLKYFFFLLSLILAWITASCVTTDDFEVPEPESTVVAISGTKITIGALKDQFDYQSKELITFPATQNYIEGYVVSSDEGGNFFKELVLQDLAKDPTAGIQVLIDQRSLYQRYDFGRRVFVKLDGLSLGLDNGVLKLGKMVGQNIEAISEFEIEKQLFRTSEIKEITPRSVVIADFDTSVESMYVTLDDMQFARDLIENPSGTLAGSANDQFQGERELQSCGTLESVILSTSVYADFKSLRIPSLQGSVTGILSKDFFGKYYVLRMNTPNDLIFSGNKRCDPEYLLCDPPINNGSSKVLFEENFDAITKTAKLEDLGWINHNSTGDDKRWENKKIRNVANRVMTISAFNSKLNPLEAWLITPEIDLDRTTDEVLSFEIQTGFNNGKALTVWATTEYKGHSDSTEWLPLDVIIPSKNANKVQIPPFSISCLTGKLRIAFRYNGRDPGATSTYSLDNVQISGVPE